MKKQVAFKLLNKQAHLELTDSGFTLNGVPLEHVMRRRDDFSIAFRAHLYIKGIQALMKEAI